MKTRRTWSASGPWARRPRVRERSARGTPNRDRELAELVLVGEERDRVRGDPFHPQASVRLPLAQQPERQLAPPLAASEVRERLRRRAAWTWPPGRSRARRCTRGGTRRRATRCRVRTPRTPRTREARSRGPRGSASRRSLRSAAVRTSRAPRRWAHRGRLAQVAAKRIEVRSRLDPGSVSSMPSTAARNSSISAAARHRNARVALVPASRRENGACTGARPASCTAPSPRARRSCPSRRQGRCPSRRISRRHAVDQEVLDPDARVVELGLVPGHDDRARRDRSLRRSRRSGMHAHRRLNVGSLGQTLGPRARAEISALSAIRPLKSHDCRRAELASSSCSHDSRGGSTNSPVSSAA